MTPTGAVVLLLVLIIAAFVFLQQRSSPEIETSTLAATMASVTLNDVPRVNSLLTRTMDDGRFAVVLFGPDGEAPAPVDSLNLQFSIEDGRVGIDWVLLAPMDVNASDRVSAFFSAEDVPVRKLEMNNVSYMRVEEGDLITLFQDSLVQVFRVTPDQHMTLISEGFAFEE
jgi:hypothetical protein